MREALRDPSRLKHMVESIHNVNQYMEDRVESDLAENSMLFFAVVKNIEIVGEAAYKLTHEFKEAHPQTPWRQIIAMRHILVHGYYQVTPSEIFNVYENDLPILLNQLTEYLKEVSDICGSINGYGKKIEGDGCGH